MAGTSRALTLKLLADVDNFTKNLNKADGEVTSFGDKVSGFGKKAGIAFAVAGAAAAAYAGKLLVDGVQSAIADEAAQAKLALTLQNVTGATNAQIAAVENQILQTSLLLGKTDDELRPSFERLVRATKDSDEAFRLQALALDISAGGTISLEAASNALARASEGNTTALSKLKTGLTTTQLATMSMEQITAELAKTFGGQAAAQADTFAGKMARLKIAFDEGKETVGSFVLDAITPMVDFIVQKVVPGVQAFIDSIGGEKGIKSALGGFISAAKSIFIPVFQGIKFSFDTIKDAVEANKEEFKTLLDFLQKYVAPFLGGVFKLAIQGIGIAIGTVVNVVAALISGFEKVIALASKIGGFVGGLFGGGKAAGGPVMQGTTYLVGEQGPELFTPSSSGNIIPNNALGRSGSTINITVNGAIDSESTARQIVQILNDSSARGTLGSAAFV